MLFLEYFFFFEMLTLIMEIHSFKHEAFVVDVGIYV